MLLRSSELVKLFFCTAKSIIKRKNHDLKLSGSGYGEDEKKRANEFIM